MEFFFPLVLSFVHRTVELNMGTSNNFNYQDDAPKSGKGTLSKKTEYLDFKQANQVFYGLFINVDRNGTSTAPTT